MKKRIVVLIVIVIILLFILNYYNLLPKKKYTAKDFMINTVVSRVDFNNNGVDDYMDFLIGAKKDAKNKPKYRSKYYSGGYPGDKEGVCTDVIWRAFKEAGYSLKDMIDNDIEKNRLDYNIKIIDKNIDFRRVVNLRVFFDKYATTLTNDIYDIDEWMPGDIVIFGNNKHIGMVSDYRNKKGIVYIIHNGGQPVRDEDYLPRAVVTKHYRFDASIVNKDILVRWNS